jgi:hypothetical protein
VQLLDDPTQRLPGFPQRPSTTGGFGREHEKCHGLLCLERHDLHVAPETALQGACHYGRQQGSRASGGAQDAHHERPSPALEREVAQAEQGKVTAEVLGPNDDIGGSNVGAQAIANLPTDVGTQGVPEVARALPAGVLAQPLHEEIGQIEARLPLFVTQLSAAQVVDNCASRVETRGHGRKGADTWQYRGRVAQAVKSRARLTRRGWTGLGWAACWLLLTLPPALEAQARLAKPAALGPAPAKEQRRCSLHRPVCVEGGTPVVQETALRLLQDAYEITVLGNQGPAWSLDPEAEPMLWLLEPGPLEFQLEPVLSLGFDRGRVRCTGGELTRSTALACAAGSSLSRAAPNTAPALKHGLAGYHSLLHDAGQTTIAAVNQAARTPERGLLSDPTTPTAALLVERIVARGAPGQGVAAAWLALVLAATKTPPGAPRPRMEPDLFDVLGSTLGKEDPHLALFWDELAALRFGKNGPLGTTAAPPEPAWEIDGASLPRNLVLPRALLPSGSAYLVVVLDAATQKTGLAVRTFCEGGSRYAWSMARMDDGGHIRSRVEVPQRDTSTHAEGTLRALEGAHGALIVGTSLGGGPGKELDPDDTPLPPHSCQVALDRVPAP